MGLRIISSFLSMVVAGVATWIVVAGVATWIMMVAAAVRAVP